VRYQPQPADDRYRNVSVQGECENTTCWTHDDEKQEVIENKFPPTKQQQQIIMQLLPHTGIHRRRLQFGGVLLAVLLLLLQSDQSKAQQQQQVLLRGTAAGSASRVLQASSSVTDLQLILAPSNQTLLLSIQENQKIFLGDLPGSTFNIKALVSVATVGSVRFAHNTNPIYRTENGAPYALCGNSGETYKVCTVLGVGNHTVTATPFAGRDATGTAGTARTVRFTIVAGSAPTGPIAPIAAPVSAAPVSAAPVPVVAPVSTAPVPVVAPVSAAPVPVVAPVSAAPVPVVAPVPGTTPRSCPVPRVRTYYIQTQHTFRTHISSFFLFSRTVGRLLGRLYKVSHLDWRIPGRHTWQ
jgi:hypothetical protein